MYDYIHLNRVILEGSFIWTSCYPNLKRESDVDSTPTLPPLLNSVSRPLPTPFGTPFERIRVQSSIYMLLIDAKRSFYSDDDFAVNSRLMSFGCNITLRFVKNYITNIKNIFRCWHLKDKYVLFPDVIAFIYPCELLDSTIKLSEEAVIKWS